MKTCNISYFKAHISRELREVRTGEHIVILDRDIPVADVVPHRREAVLPVRSPTAELAIRRLDIRVKKDPLAVLQEERGKR